MERHTRWGCHQSATIQRGISCGRAAGGNAFRDLYFFTEQFPVRLLFKSVCGFGLGCQLGLAEPHALGLDEIKDQWTEKLGRKIPPAHRSFNLPSKLPFLQ